MIIRFTKATRFFCVCVLLLITGLISIGTKIISVSAPYAAQPEALPVVVYRGAGESAPTAVSLRELAADLAWLSENGYSVLSEQDLVASLRRETPLPSRPILMLFDDTAGDFAASVLPLLEEHGFPWFSLSKSTLLTQELRTAGYAVTRLERSGGFTLAEQIAAAP